MDPFFSARFKAQASLSTPFIDDAGIYGTPIFRSRIIPVSVGCPEPNPVIKGDVDLEHINKKVDINDDLVISVLSHQIKTRRESISEFEKGNRIDLINKTNVIFDMN